MARVARAHAQVALAEAAAAVGTRGKAAEVGGDRARAEAALGEAGACQVDHLVVHALHPVAGADLDLCGKNGG